jgi:hypothetical protein
MVRAILCVIGSMTIVSLSLPSLARGEEFWALVTARGKGDDYLWVIDVTKPELPGRRLRCETTLPRYVEDTASAAERIKADVLVRCEGTVIAERGGERVQELKIKMVCIAPRKNYPLLGEMKSWASYAQALPDEPKIDALSLPLPR